jgi:hypothetical protein
VRPSDFGLTAKLDPLSPWTKVAIMLWQCIGSMDQKHASGSALTFFGRKEALAKKLQADAMKDLVQEIQFVRSVETFIKSMLSIYSQPSSQEPQGFIGTQLLGARGELLANCGRYLLKVGQVLEHALKIGIAKQRPLTPPERLEVVNAECAGKFSKIEDYFRKELVKRKLYTAESLPASQHPQILGAGTTAVAPKQASGAGAVKRQVDVAQSSQVESYVALVRCSVQLDCEFTRASLYACSEQGYRSFVCFLYCLCLVRWIGVLASSACFLCFVCLLVPGGFREPDVLCQCAWCAWYA